jgi:hypothetical protein
LIFQDCKNLEKVNITWGPFEAASISGAHGPFIFLKTDKKPFSLGTKIKSSKITRPPLPLEKLAQTTKSQNRLKIASWLFSPKLPQPSSGRVKFAPIARLNSDKQTSPRFDDQWPSTWLFEQLMMVKARRHPFRDWLVLKVLSTGAPGGIPKGIGWLLKVAKISRSQLVTNMTPSSLWPLSDSLRSGRVRPPFLTNKAASSKEDLLASWLII